MSDVQIPISGHFFTPQALQTALDRAIPAADLGPDHHGAAVAAIDSEGVKTALIFTSKDDKWRVRAAWGHDWSGNDTAAGDILYRF